MFEINGTFFIFALLFAGFIFLFNELALKPVGQVIEERKRLIKNDLDAAQASKVEAVAVLASYEEHIHSSRLEGQRLIQEALQSAQAKRDEQLKQLQLEGNEKIEKIRAELASNRKSIITALIESETELVQNIIQKLIGDSQKLVVDRQQVAQALEEAS